ncbi:SNF1-interacting protein [Parahypoxylon ruwenzoriense]
MGNTHTKELRGGSRTGGHLDPGGSSSGAGYHGDLPDRSRRASRPELSGLGLPFGGSSSSRHQDAPFEHRETKQEKEARRLERERATRLRERELSMKEEHVDGGYLVTMGIYTASEDFSKPVVRQLQIERKLAPFWRGLDDFNESWAEHQIIAAARGLEIPPADEVPEYLIPQPRPTESLGISTPNLTVPIGPRTLSACSDKIGSNPGSAVPSPTSPAAPRAGSPFKPHKSLAAALNLSRNGSHTDITPREINLPHDPFVNGQPLEVFLYKEGIECPLCLMYYPPYLNRTRCCCQIICSECFVQIKRPDPHLPEHHGDDEVSHTQANTEEAAGELVMEPARCPYCTQTEFGVTYEPPPFRRGLTYAFNSAMLGTMSTAMSSSSSLNSNLSPTPATPPSNANRRRTQSVSANAPGVITTDRIRPDWSTKLAAARAQQRRRAAAADALHHAAFVMGNQESRTIFGRPSRFGRRNAGGNRGTSSPGSTSNTQPNEAGVEGPSDLDADLRVSSGRSGVGRERIDAAHLENLMMAEAIRLSLADEEERRKKAEKEARKEAKKREKEERKTAKKKGEVYGGASSASASSLSLGLGRRRGNSAASNLRMEASIAAASNTSAAQEASGSVSASTSALSSNNKGKAVDRGKNEETQMGGTSVPPLQIPLASQPSRGSSHLRQMSNASSVSSSGVDSIPGSYTGKGSGANAEDPRSSGLSLGGRNEDSGDNSEPMFNFRSLAEMVGVPIDGDSLSLGGNDLYPSSKSAEGEEAQGEHIERVEALADGRGEKKEAMPRIETQESSQSPEARGGPGTSPPHLIVTPDTPASVNDENEDFKQLGHVDMEERPHEVTQ